MSSSWEHTKNEMMGKNKAQRRRIDFVKSASSSTVLSGGRPEGAKGKGHGLPVEKTESKKKADEDKISGPVPGLFPPERVLDNMHWKKISRVGAGYFNHGNTCFLNSTLQCLYHIPAFTQVLIQDRNMLLKANNQSRQKSVFEHYLRFVEEASSPNCARVISPRGMVQNIRLVSKQFRPMRQEDAHEYLRQLLDCMHEDILKARGLKISSGKIAETTLISRIFGGYLCNELKCSSCHYSSKTYNHFQDLSLDVVHGIRSVEEAISAFIRPERLGAGNEWLCGGCKKKVQATKQMTIAKAPNVLVLHLKRFSFGHGFGKVTKPISYEPNLHLPCSSESTKTVPYSLNGIIVHHGGSVHSGHYVAYVKAPNGEWNEMNDTHVSSVSQKTVLNSQAYVLFYVRSDVKKSKPPAPADNVISQKESVQNPSDSLKLKSEMLKQKWAEGDVGAAVSRKEQLKVVPNGLSNGHSSTVPDEVDSASKHNGEQPAAEGAGDGVSRLPNRDSSIIKPFRFKGKLDSFFVRPGIPVLKLRGQSGIKHSLGTEVGFNEGSEIDAEIDVRKIETPAARFQSETVQTNVDSTAKAPTLLRQLINLGKRGTEAGAEGGWEDAPTVDQKLADLQHKQKMLQRSILGKRQSGDWNKMLDAGRQKKVKIKAIPEDNGDDSFNPFQSFEENNKFRKRGY